MNVTLIHVGDVIPYCLVDRHKVSKEYTAPRFETEETGKIFLRNIFHQILVLVTFIAVTPSSLNY
jgi:hypothetical protein